MSEKLYLGIDGGQSSTVAIIGDSNGVVLGVGQAGPCNHVKNSKHGPAKLRRAILGAARAAWRNVPANTDAATSARSRLPVFESAYFGMSGGPEDKAAIIAQIIRARNLEVTHDAATALIGSTEGRPGIIVISGTGSICFGMNAAGATARAGGWGYVFGDEGSSFDIARRALRASLAMEEGWGPSTALRDHIIEFTRGAEAPRAAAAVTEANAVLHAWYTDAFPRSRVAAFARIVDECAINGDKVARGILRHAAQDLASLVEQVRKRLFRAKDEALVSYIGGAFKSRILLTQYRKNVHALGSNRVMPPALGPAGGALLAAYRLSDKTREVRLRNLPLDL